MTLQHAFHISSLEFLPDGYLVSSDGNGEIMLWDTVTGSCARTVKAHSWVTRLSVSQSKSKLASTSWKTVSLWDTMSWECMSMFECDDLVLSVALYPSGIQVAACTEETLYVWHTGDQQLTVSKNISECKCVAVSHDGKWLAVASSKTILYDAGTLDCIWSHDNVCNSVSFSPDSHQLVCGHSGGVQLLNAQTGSRVNSFQHENVQRAVFFHDCTRVISGESCSAAVSLVSYIYQLPLMALVDFGTCT